MKKVSTLFLTLIMAIAAFPAFAQSLLPQSREAGKNRARNVYCLEMHHPGWGRSYGIASFNTSNPSNFNLVQDLYKTNLGGGDNAVFSGAAADDVYYTYFYQYNVTEGAMPFCFATVNIRNGETKQLINYKLNLEVPKFYDMTYDYSTKTMYGAAFIEGEYQLYTIDLKTGVMTPNVSIQKDSRVSAIAASMDGRLYGFGGSGDLILINKTTGTTAKVLSTGLQDIMWASLEFDHTDGTLYGAIYQARTPQNPTGKQGTSIVKFNLTTQTYEKLGFIDDTKVFGLYIPYLISGFDAPGVPTDLKVEIGEKGAEKATVSWKNPAKTYGEDNLSAITSMKILRDGAEVKTFTNVTPGQTMSWEDTTIKVGDHIYSIYGTNEKGDGDFGKIDFFVGKDIPAEVHDLNIRVNAGYDNTTITWTAPTEGARKGYFDDKGLTYTVVRYPDSVIVAKNITDLTYTDQGIKRLALYNYGVTASNSSGQGREAFSLSMIMGKPASLPYTIYFDNRNQVMNTWSGNDHNQDGCSWIFNLGIGDQIFGSTDTAAEYIAVEGGLDADDWLISPPFNFTKGTKYSLSFSTRSLGEDSLVVSLVTIDKPRKDFKTIKVQGDSPASGGVAPWITTQMELPSDIETGAYCIGIHLVTPFGNSAYIQLTNFNLVEGSGIESESIQPGIKVFHHEGLLSIDGEFNKADIYNAAGWIVGHTDANNPVLNTANWGEGLYFVKVTKGETSKVYKIFIK